MQGRWLLAGASLPDNAMEMACCGEPGRKQVAREGGVTYGKGFLRDLKVCSFAPPEPPRPGKSQHTALTPERKGAEKVQVDK